MKFCKDCKHFSLGPSFTAQCNANKIIQVETGETWVSAKECRMVYGICASARFCRMDDSFCGPKAKWYEPNDKAKLSR